MTYAELTPALPFAGGELVFAYRAGGYGFAWFTAWAMCFAYVAVAAWEGVAFGAPAKVRNEASIPVADVAAWFFGSRIFGSLVIVAGIGGILTSWNAMYLPFGPGSLSLPHRTVA